MHDVTCVLTVIGACEKISSDTVRWVGLSRVPAHLRALQTDARVDIPDTSLDAIIGSCEVISISSLTVRFLLCLLLLRMPTMDIQKVSRYPSRKTKRYKSTLCKAYQIAHILEAASVLKRSAVAGEVTLEGEFFAPVEIARANRGYGIQELLNRADPSRTQSLTLGAKSLSEQYETARWRTCRLDDHPSTIKRS
jgi:hypothetical protein